MSEFASRRLSLLGFLLGAGAGAVAYVLLEEWTISLLCFATIWYALGYGVVRARAHPQHRRIWIVHVVLFPTVWIAATVVFWLWLGYPFGALLLGAALGAAVQALVTRLGLHEVKDDQLHDLRHRLGIE